MEQAIVYIGIDVAKAHLDVSGAVQCRRFSNERSGHVALVRWLKTSQAPMQLICEASGGYEQALSESLAEEHVAITLVQALRVRHYARAAGILAKTDRIDARVLAAFGAALRPKPTPRLSRQQEAFARTGVPASAFKPGASRRRESSGATSVCRAAFVRPQFDQ